MTTPRFKSTLALLVAATTIFSITFSPLLAAGNAEFNGRVLQVDGVSPQPGVVIVLLDTQNSDANDAANSSILCASSQILANIARILPSR